MLLAGNVQFAPPPLELLARYHPQFALAIWRGVPVRADTRIMTTTFSNTAVGTQQTGVFDEQISQYSIFTGCVETIDPTNAFPGSNLKTLSDAAQSMVTGITVQLQIKGKNGAYDPIPTQMPLQLVPGLLTPMAGIWAMDNPDSGRAVFTISATPLAVPFTPWLALGFVVLGPDGCDFLSVPRAQAQEELRKAGILCGCRE